MEFIEAIFCELGYENFRDNIWEKKSYFSKGVAYNCEQTKELLNQISIFLDRTDIRYPSLRIAKDGKEIPLENYTRELRIGPHTSHDWIVNELVFSHYLKGATIVLQHLQHCLPSFGTVINKIEEFFGANTHLSCFITPPNSQGFTAHYDTYSFFAVQLYGEKKWNLYDKTSQPPIRDDRDYDLPWTQISPSESFTMCAGDVLYIPRGVYHSALTSSLPSIHATVGVFTPNWIDVAKESIKITESLSQFRQSVSDKFYCFDDFDKVDKVNELLGLNIDLNVGIEKIKENIFCRHIDSRVGRLDDLLSIATSSVPLTYGRQKVPFKIGLNGSNAVLKFANKEMRFPGFVYETLCDICNKSDFFDIELISSNLDKKSLTLLFRKLVEEGFLTISKIKSQ